MSKGSFPFRCTLYEVALPLTTDLVGKQLSSNGSFLLAIEHESAKRLSVTTHRHFRQHRWLASTPRFAAGLPVGRLTSSFVRSRLDTETSFRLTPARFASSFAMRSTAYQAPKSCRRSRPPLEALRDLCTRAFGGEGGMITGRGGSHHQFKVVRAPTG